MASPTLAAQLARAERTKKLKAVLLTAPLLLFLLLTFLAPIGALLTKSFVDTEVADALPNVTREIKRWDGRALPDEATFAALIDDVRAARAAGTLAPAATRLNYDVSGFRTLLFSTARQLPERLELPARETLLAIDPKWSEVETWGAIARAAGPTTSLYLLAAVDLKLTADGRLVGAPREEAIFVQVLGRTFAIATAVTVLCLVLGYPLAYVLASLPARTANALLVLVLLPFWTSLLVRTSAWIVLLQHEGVLNSALLQAGLIDQPLEMLYRRAAVYAAMTHVLLPFMVLPLYAVMRQIPPVHVRAALSLGAPPSTAFWRVYAPQTLPGVGAGVLMVFIQALGYYITPALVGGPDDQMLSYFIAFYASKTINWGMAAALSLALLAATVALYYVYDRLVGIDRIRMG
ncbi:MAG: ABC transporter permease [Pseudomonadota bacterium]|jgi:putative spermidine/putrescine transport system permease protein